MFWNGYGREEETKKAAATATVYSAGFSRYDCMSSDRAMKTVVTGFDFNQSIIISRRVDMLVIALIGLRDSPFIFILIMCNRSVDPADCIDFRSHRSIDAVANSSFFPTPIRISTRTASAISGNISTDFMCWKQEKPNMQLFAFVCASSLAQRWV